MKIIIPLASNDKDFQNKYGKIKHLCNVGLKPMIENFVDHFKFNHEYIFLCKNKDIIEKNGPLQFYDYGKSERKMGCV